MSDITYSYRPYIYRASNGTELLIQIYVGDQAGEDGDPTFLVRMATRASKWETWGPPLEFERAP
jgi:hypothetical protein